MPGIEQARVYLVPVIDVNWLTFAPFDPGRGYRVDPPKIEQSIGETDRLVGLMNELTDGRYVLTPHSGIYCREAFYEAPFVDIYRSGVARGAEIAVHLHEEVKGVGVRFGEVDHVREMFALCCRKLEAAALPFSSYRGGHYAYAPFMNALLEEHGIFIDLSCLPGLNEPTREAVWVNAKFSGYYQPDDPCAANDSASKVFEIPMGCDGQGTGYTNILHIEQSNLDNLKRIWVIVRDRAAAEGRAQIVQCLFHTASVGRQDYVDRLKGFFDHVVRNGGVLTRPSEAKLIFDEGKDSNR
ncbi:polysaccharide deacetylase family protein [Shumkonia mesophila]|uniref:hypothetical protein n=1 Tax=Shumkonia mesophila TaxID=2838854 RepID=UPI00293490F7|nr:hypothetical protein [Shumkonia mesophila]